MKRPKRPCRFPTCKTKVESGYCDDHKHHERKFASKKSDPWYHLSVKQANRLGFPANWKGNPNKPLGERGGLREAQLIREPFCRMCRDKGIVNDVTGKGRGVVDHVIPFRSAPTERQQRMLFIDPDNHQTLCVPCNSEKTGRDGSEATPGRVKSLNK